MVVSLEYSCNLFAVYVYLIIFNLQSSVDCDVVASSSCWEGLGLTSSAGGMTAEDVDSAGLPLLPLLDLPLALPFDETVDD